MPGFFLVFYKDFTLKSPQKRGLWNDAKSLGKFIHTVYVVLTNL